MDAVKVLSKFIHLSWDTQFWSYRMRLMSCTHQSPSSPSMTSSFLLNHKEFARIARENRKSAYTVFVIVRRLPPPPLSDDVICERSLSMCYLYETSRKWCFCHARQGCNIIYSNIPCYVSLFWSSFQFKMNYLSRRCSSSYFFVFKRSQMKPHSFLCNCNYN